MKKYKHSNLIKNPSETSYPKPDLPKTSMLYDKFLATNKIKKSTTTPVGANSEKKRDGSESLNQAHPNDQKYSYDHNTRVISSSTGEQKTFTNNVNYHQDNTSNPKD